jgi:hypothetical protein
VDEHDLRQVRQRALGLPLERVEELGRVGGGRHRFAVGELAEQADDRPGGLRVADGWLNACDHRLFPACFLPLALRLLTLRSRCVCLR